MKQALEDVKNMMEQEDDDQEVLELSEASLVKTEVSSDGNVSAQVDRSVTQNESVGASASINTLFGGKLVKKTEEKKAPATEDFAFNRVQEGKEAVDLTVISKKSAQETVASLKNLMKTVEKKSQDSPGFRNGTMLEDLIKELIRPQITSWLDVNLPAVVRAVVEKEVRKLIPRDE